MKKKLFKTIRIWGILFLLAFAIIIMISKNVDNQIIKSAKILIMDDEKMICKVCSQMLEGLGFSSETCFDGKEAIELYSKKMNTSDKFDLIIMDLTVPGGMGGIDSVKEILKIDPNAKVIVSSGYASETILDNYATYGFAGMVAKPYTMKKLKEAVSALLSKS